MSDVNSTYNLSPVQEQVIAAIAGGATLIAAADAASIHRNTIAYWRRTSHAFCEALDHAQYDKALFVRDEAETHVADAFAAIHAILTNPDASDGARLNAAKFIIEKASTPPQPPPQAMHRPEPAAIPETTHSSAQIPDSPQPEIPPTATPETTHSSAQIPDSPQPEIPPTVTQSVRSSPKVGRNDPCPCGSHLKFKRCCLGKPHLTMAA